MNTLILLFVLICLVQIICIIVWKKAKKIHRIRTIIPLALIMILLYLGFFYQLRSYHEPQPIPQKEYSQKTLVPTPDDAILKQLWERKTGSIHFLYFLYQGKEKSESVLENIAFGLRQKHCTSPCIINLYDDQKAFETDRERISITSDETMREWNKKHYVFVADHYLGYLDAVEDAAFAYYPFRDSYYKKVKLGSLDTH